LYASAALLGAIAFCRAVGFLLHGVPPAVVAPFMSELALVAALVYAARRLRSEGATEVPPKG